MMRESTLLFNTYDLDLVLQAHGKKIKELTSAVPPQKLLEANIEELVPNIEKEIRVEPLELLEDNLSVDQEETKVDVSQDFMRHVIDRSHPFYIDGLRVSYYVPFKGDKELFKCKPNTFTFNPPYARVSANEIVFEYDRADRNIVTTKPLFERDLSNVRQWIAWGKHLGAVYSNSRYVVIFVSKYYAEKVWPNHERQHAQARALKNQDDTILPARFDDTEIPGLPSTISYINLRKTTPDELAEKINRKLNQGESH